MSERENSRAQREALKSSRSATPSETRRAQEDALARYLRLQAERPPRERSKRGEEEDTSTTTESR